MKQQITLLPYGGLCNRMNAITSALTLAEMHPEAQVEILWTPKKWCAAPFSALFEPIGNDRVRLADVPSLPLLRQRSLPRNLRMAGRIRELLGIRNIEDYYPGRHDIFALMGKAQKVYISTCQRFLAGGNQQSLFTPLPHILATLDRATAAFTPSTYGFHIRRGDHAYSTAHSPLEAFTARMDALAEADAQARFYIATDDATVKQTLTTRYAHRIITYQATLERHSLAGMQDAVVELFALSRTRKIYGSATSSYSEVAAELGGIEIETVRKDDGK